MRLLITISFTTLLTLPLLATNNQDTRPIDTVKSLCDLQTDSLVDDHAFIRRIWLDLTGRLPDQRTIDRFVRSNDPDKRADMIDLAIGSTAFVDRWTNFLEEIFRSRYLVFFEPNYRNMFHEFLHESVAQNKPWDQMAREIMTYYGDGNAQGSTFTFWVVKAIDTEFRLDYLDDQIGFITESMLGVKMNCISCHDGAYHLEEINVGLTAMKRQQFWEMSAFLASSYLYLPFEAFDNAQRENYVRQLHIVDVDDPDYERYGYMLAEEPYHEGEYLALSEAGDGMRQPRNGGIVSPKYFRNGEQPQAGENRREALARLITADRQFARNMVNRVWAHLIGEGFVHPIDDWDLGRVDKTTAAQYESTVQPRNPELMESLTDAFINSGYDLRDLIRNIVETGIYQWDYARADNTCNDAYAYWREDRRVRRLEAEAIVENYLRFLDIDLFYVVTGYPFEVAHSLWQMPGSIEPNPAALFKETDRGDYQLLNDPINLGYESLDEYFQVQNIVLSLLEQLGRDDRIQVLPRNNASSIQMSLLMMNNPVFSGYLENPEFSPYLATMVRNARNSGSYSSIIDQMFMKALVRMPTSEERSFCLETFQNNPIEQAIPNLAWALINHSDFLYK